ncbi:hypothetical protein [Zhongshania sp.]|uniref:hypothetical protein n=1 Tax=Zhongshania sp. TaxID=1971902 RepID=UPI00356422A5
MTKRMSVCNEVYCVLEELGNGSIINCRVVQDKLPWASKGAVAGALTQFCKKGILTAIDDVVPDPAGVARRLLKQWAVSLDQGSDVKFHSAPKHYTRSGVIRVVKEKHADRDVCGELEDKMLNGLADISSYIRELEEKVKNPDLSALDEKLLWAEIRNRRNAEGKKTGSNPGQDPARGSYENVQLKGRKKIISCL